MCVQTKQFYTFHICPTMLDANMVDLEDHKNKHTLELGIARHGMSWCAGTDQLCDVRDYLYAMIQKDADVFTNDKDLRSLFSNWGYEEVHNLNVPPMKNLNNQPASTCGAYGHDTGFKNCAQRKCFEAMCYLNNTLVPYLDPTILKYPRVNQSIHEERSDYEVKFGEMKLHPFDFKKLSPVRLPHYYNGVTHCQYCVAGSDGCTCAAGSAQEKGDEDSERGGGEASNVPAGTTNCKVWGPEHNANIQDGKI